jgi:transposase
MRTQVEHHAEEAEKVIRDIRRATRRQYSAEEKVRIVIAGLRGEDSIAELCRKEGINQNLYYRWSKEFLEAGKKRLAGDTAREATSDEVKGLRVEAQQLKELLAEAISRPPLATSGADQPFSHGGKTSNKRPLNYVGGCISRPSPELQPRAHLSLILNARCLNCSDDVQPYRLSSEWRNSGTCPADCRASVTAHHQTYDRTKDEISLDEVERIKF